MHIGSYLLFTIIFLLGQGIGTMCIGPTPILQAEPLFLMGMKMVIVGGSGHFEYALEPSVAIPVRAYAPGSKGEDLTRLQKVLPNTKTYSNYLEMLDQEQPDLAVINPHFHLHASIVLECLKRGIHCFCEKPLAFQLERLENIERLYQESGVHLTTMMMHRYEPWFYAAFEAVSQGRVGTPVLIQAQKSYKMGRKPLWMQLKSKFGGIIPWVGAHALDLSYWMAQKDLDIQAAQQTLLGNQGNGEVESAAVVQYTWNGGVGHAQLDYLRPDTANSHGDDRIRVVGTEGIIEVRNSKAVLHSSAHGEEDLTLLKGPGLLEEFIQQIEKGIPCRISAQDSFKVTRWCIEAEALAQKNNGE